MTNNLCSIWSQTISLCSSVAGPRLHRSQLAAQWTWLVCLFLLWLHMLICSVHPSVPLSATAWIQLHQTHPSLCYPHPLRFFLVLIPHSSPTPSFLLGCLLSWDAAVVVWQHMNRRGEREKIKRENITEGHKGRKTTELWRWNINLTVREEL